MSPSPDPPFDSKQQGISLDELAAAFAQVMGTEPRRSDKPADEASPAVVDASSDSSSVAGDSENVPGTLEDAGSASAEADSGQGVPGDVDPESELAEADGVKDDACPISPQTILEAMLFVGNRDNRPLSPTRAAELMRGVQADEIPVLIEVLNQSYADLGSPYEIVSEGDGYRLVIRQTLNSITNRFFGKVREGRLSQPAIDVLAIVAYQQPITGEKVRQLRDKPSSHILAHLVQRGLLRVERPDPKQRTPHYFTTDRFLQLFNLQSLDDLPRSEDPNQL